MRSEWHGTTWWTRQHGTVADTSVGTITQDSVAICDALFGGSCPNEFAYVRDSGASLVLYLPIPGVAPPLDTLGGGITYTRGSFAPADTIPPPDAPGPVQLAGVWTSDTVTWSGTPCTGFGQYGFVSDTAVAIEYQVQTWGRPCGDTAWTQLPPALGVALPYPCTPADSCDFTILPDSVTASSNLWDLLVTAADTLTVGPSSLIQGWAPTRFVRDSGAVQLARSGHPPSRILKRRSLRAVLRALQRDRERIRLAVRR